MTKNMQDKKQQKKLQLYRKKIDQVDAGLLRLLERRLKIVNQIGQYKKKMKLNMHDPKREALLIARATKKLRKGSSRQIVLKNYTLILKSNLKFLKDR